MSVFIVFIVMNPLNLEFEDKQLPRVLCDTFWGCGSGAAASSLVAAPADAAGGGAAGAKLKSLDSRSKAVFSSIVCDTEGFDISLLCSTPSVVFVSWRFYLRWWGCFFLLLFHFLKNQI